jgi:hypothetical protein
MMPSARSRDILAWFLVEAVVLAPIGVLLGILLADPDPRWSASSSAATPHRRPPVSTPIKPSVTSRPTQPRERARPAPLKSDSLDETGLEERCFLT